MKRKMSDIERHLFVIIDGFVGMKKANRSLMVLAQ
jgi:hypothetical protein